MRRMSISSTGAVQENIYEPICPEPDDDDANSRRQEENIYETIEEVRRQQQENLLRLQQPSTSTAPDLTDPIYDRNLPSCSSSSTYGRIGNAYGRIDIIGHGIGRIERHLSSSCGSINSNHYAIESLYGTSSDRTVTDLSLGRISKVSVQWLLANKWLPLWIANTESGKDYRIIDFLIAQGLEQMEENERESETPGEDRPPSGGGVASDQPPPPSSSSSSGG